MKTNQIKEELLLLPITIKEKELLVYELIRKKNELEYRLKLIESNIYMEISNHEIDGKKFYSSEKIRESELNKRLKLNDEYYCIKKEIEDIEIKLHESKAWLEFYKNEFKAIQYLIKMMEFE